MRFEHPLYLFGIALVIWFSVRIFFGRRIAHSAVRFFSGSGVVRSYEWAQRALLALCGIAAVLYFARPLAPTKMTTAFVKARDFAITIDFSGSMDESFGGVMRVSSPFGVGYPVSSGDSKLAIAQRVALAFVGEHPESRIAVLIFDTETYVKSPLIKDQRGVTKWLSEQHSSLPNGTTITRAILRTIDHMYERGGIPGTRAIILISDGQDSDVALEKNQIQMAALLKKHGIRFWYLRTVPVSQQDYWSDDNVNLKKLSEDSGGGTFTVVDEGSVKTAFAHISKLESALIPVTIPGTESGFDGTFIAIAAGAFALLFVAKLLLDLA